MFYETLLRGWDGTRVGSPSARLPRRSDCEAGHISNLIKRYEEIVAESSTLVAYP
jgi:hypothetical protein